MQTCKVWLLWLGSAGQEYEALLSAKLRCAGIAFFSEDKLREEGFFKTPDVKLEVWTRIPACHTCYMAPACILPGASLSNSQQEIPGMRCRAALLYPGF